LWFMVGLHFPMLHEMIDHGRAPNWPVLTIVLLMTVLAVAGLWLLLRASVQWTSPSSSDR
jgi:hypothetical protein